MSVNRVLLVGNLTRDPELRGREGTVLAFGLAVNDRRRNPETDEWEDVPNYFDCVMFGKRAKALEPYLHKGDKVAIEGRLRWSQWEQDGTKRSKVEVVAEEVEFMSRRDGGGGRRGRTAPAREAPAQGYVAAPGSYQPTLPQQPPRADVYDEDIPF